MMDKARRILALLLMLLVLSGAAGLDHFVLLTAYASDETVGDSREEDLAELADLNDGEEFVPETQAEGTDEPTDVPSEDPATVLTDDMTDDPGNGPADDESNDLIDDMTDDQSDNPGNDQTDDLTENQADDPTDEPSDDPDEAAPAEEEPVEEANTLYEGSGDYLSVCITGTCPDDLQPEASTVTIRDNGLLRVLEAWTRR